MFDPLLTSAPNYDIQSLEQIQNQVANNIAKLRQISQQQNDKSQTPVWDEIDALVSQLSDKEMQYISEDESFNESNNAVSALVNREFMRIMRPIVEATKDGKEALEEHLALVKRLRKSASDRMNKKYELLDEYIEHHSDISFEEFLAKKKGAKKK